MLGVKIAAELLIPIKRQSGLLLRFQDHFVVIKRHRISL